MIVISDTTPIISLLKINHLHLLRELFDEIQVPEAVYNELVSNARFPQEARIILNTQYVKRVSVEDKKSVVLLKQITGLDAGESEAIILADEKKADILLMDEAKGRQVAKQLGLHIMGTIGILISAFEEQLLSVNEIELCVETMRNHGRYISDKLYQQLMEKIKS